ncbi:MAG: hypothetical protein AAF086_03345 [Planctomycetota bacterium]
MNIIATVLLAVSVNLVFVANSLGLVVVTVTQDGVFQENATELLQVELSADYDISVLDRQHLRWLAKERVIDWTGPRPDVSWLGAEWLIFVDQSDEQTRFELVDAWTGQSVARETLPSSTQSIEWARRAAAQLNQAIRDDLPEIPPTHTLAVARLQNVEDVDHPENWTTAHHAVGRLTDNLPQGFGLLRRGYTSVSVREQWLDEQGFITPDEPIHLAGARFLLQPAIAAAATQPQGVELRLAVIDAALGQRVGFRRVGLPLDVHQTAALNQWLHQTLIHAIEVESTERRSRDDNGLIQDFVLSAEMLSDFYEGVRQFDAGRYDLAIEMFSRAQQRNIRLRESYEWIGRSFTQLDMPEYADAVESNLRGEFPIGVSSAIRRNSVDWLVPEYTPGTLLLQPTISPGVNAALASVVSLHLVDSLRQAQPSTPLLLTEDVAALTAEYDARAGLDRPKTLVWRNAPRLIRKNTLTAHIDVDRNAEIQLRVTIYPGVSTEASRQVTLALPRQTADWSDRFHLAVSDLFDTTNTEARNHTLPALENEIDPVHHRLGDGSNLGFWNARRDYVDRVLSPRDPRRAHLDFFDAWSLVERKDTPLPQARDEFRALMHRVIARSPDNPAAWLARYNLLIAGMDQRSLNETLRLGTSLLADIEAGRAAKKPLPENKRGFSQLYHQSYNMMRALMPYIQHAANSQDVVTDQSQEFYRPGGLYTSSSIPMMSGSGLPSGYSLWRRPATPLESQWLLRLIPRLLFQHRSLTAQEILVVLDEGPKSADFRRFILWTFSLCETHQEASSHDAPGTRDRVAQLYLTELTEVLNSDSQRKELSEGQLEDLCREIMRRLPPSEKRSDELNQALQHYRDAAMVAIQSGWLGNLTPLLAKAVLGREYDEQSTQPLSEHLDALRKRLNAADNPFADEAWPGWHNDLQLAWPELAEQWVLPYLDDLHRIYGQTPEDLNDLDEHLNVYMCVARNLFRGGFYTEAETILQKIAEWEPLPDMNDRFRWIEVVPRSNAGLLWALCRQRMGDAPEAIRLAQQTLERMGPHEVSLIVHSTGGSNGNQLTIRPRLDRLIQKLRLDPDAPFHDPFTME